jgi:putative ABC transport system permease protein
MVYLDTWRGDLRFAWRGAVRRPAFTLLVVTTLALGLGVGSAVFALVDAALLRPLPYSDPSRLVFVWQTLPAHNVFELEATPADLEAWRGAHSFSGLAMVSPGSFTLTGTAEPERLRGSRVTASLMPLLGVSPAIGRGFTPDEDSDRAAPVAIVSDGLWRRRFGANAAVLGARIDVDGLPHTIVGVMPRSRHLPGPLTSDDEIWLPMRMTPAERDNAISHNYTIIGRLASGIATEEASAEMAAIAAAQARDNPDTHRTIGARVVSFSDQASAKLKRPLLVLLAGVLLLMLIAAANTATLLLARTSERHQEMALRSAIGANGLRLFSLAVAEALLFSMLGALAGIALGRVALQSLLPLFRDVIPAGLDVNIDARVTLATLSISVLSGIAFGAINASQYPQALLFDRMQSGARTTAGSPAGGLRNGLVAAQVALAVMLLAAAGLLVKSFAKLNGVSPGFDAPGVLTFRLSLPVESYRTREQRAAFGRELIAGLEMSPGVRSVAINTRLPFGGSRGANSVEVEGKPPAPGELRIVDQREITPDYFRTMNIHGLRGRQFTAQDDARAEPVVIVNRAMAERMWGRDDPIDKRIRVAAGDDASGWLRVVGVVDDVHHIDLARDPVPEMYRPFAQMPEPDFMVAIRSTGDATSVAAAAHTVVQTLDGRLPIYDVRTMEARIASSVAQSRAMAALLLTTALLAAALATIAIYGSIWYSVAQRTPEIGVRLALGATPVSVFTLVTGRAIALSAVGASIGSAGALASAPLLGSLLFDTRTADPWTYLAVAGGLLLLTLAASAVPARRAMRVDPIRSLKSEV